MSYLIILILVLWPTWVEAQLLNVGLGLAAGPGAKTSPSPALRGSVILDSGGEHRKHHGLRIATGTSVGMVLNPLLMHRSTHERGGADSPGGDTKSYCLGWCVLRARWRRCHSITGRRVPLCPTEVRGVPAHRFFGRKP